MRSISLRTKLLGALLVVGLLALVVTGWQASRRAEASLRQAAMNHLTSIREDRRQQIEAYFSDVRRDALALAESRDVIAAMPAFTAARHRFAADVARWPAATRDRVRAQVEDYYRHWFVTRVRGPELDEDDVRRMLPSDDVTRVLQALFIVENPNPEAARDRLDRPAGGGAYADVHASFNPFLRSVTRQYGYHNLFLVDHEDGRIVYSVAKEVEFGTSLLSGPYSSTKLARAYRAGRAAVEADFVQLVDFEAHVPSLGAPAAFVAAPIFKEGRRLGVLVLQIPGDRINAVMTGGRRWEEHGLGRTGET